MTVLDDRELADWYAMAVSPPDGPVRSRGRAMSYRPGPVRPPVAPLRYRGSGVAVSCAAHTRRPVSATVTVGLAAVAALITLWLGSLAHFSGDRAAAPAQIPDRLAVVQVQAGETLRHLAGRVAPDSPVGQVVDRIRDLNDLDSAAVDAGQTLIAPIG
ncbi:MAG: LysM peptidoglycan-binding domain-containing protein [Mycobacteriaceae bacterium]